MDSTAKKILMWGGVAVGIYWLSLPKRQSDTVPADLPPNVGSPGDFNGLPGSDPDSGL